ncbi:universal stress protein family 4 [Bosea sp. BIWAKO-01]|nr:universal stress protein family 4 [Bosea sp. BIWAKO-01]
MDIERDRARAGGILLASDFSPRSDRALDRALRIAGEWSAPLAILHVEEPPERQGKPADLIRDELRGELPPQASTAELVIRIGSLPTVLVAEATERHSALIVTAVARHNSIGDYILGTSVDYIVRKASVPVLVVRRRADRSYGTVIVATDFSDCSRRALAVAADFFPHAGLRVIHAYPGSGFRMSLEDRNEHNASEASARMAAFLEAAKLPAEAARRIETELHEGEISAAIERCRRVTGAELVVLGRSGRKELVQALIGSTAETILNTVHADILIVP